MSCAGNKTEERFLDDDDLSGVEEEHLQHPPHGVVGVERGPRRDVGAVGHGQVGVEQVSSHCRLQ